MSANSIGVLIVDDHALIADSLAAALGEDPDLEVLGVAGTAAEAYQLVGDFAPDVVLMDFRLPDDDGAAVTDRIREQHPGIQVLMITGYDDVEALSRAIDAGCAGYLHKSTDLGSVVNAVHLVNQGGELFPAEGLTHLVRLLKKQLAMGAYLTSREREVLNLIAEGVTTDVVAARMGISKNTARSHVRNILSKLDVHSKLEAVMLGLRLGLVGVREEVPVGQ